MKKLNYIAWIKLGIILLAFFLFSTSTVKKIIPPINNYEIWIGSIVWFLLSFFGIPAFCTPDEVYKPKWNDSPFLFQTHPEILKAHKKRFFLVCFHFSGYLLLAVGLGAMINSLIRSETIYLIEFQKIILGTGCLIGVYRATKKTYASHT
jgi:hypothetical protein